MTFFPKIADCRSHCHQHPLFTLIDIESYPLQIEEALHSLPVSLKNTLMNLNLAQRRTAIHTYVMGLFESYKHKTRIYEMIWELANKPGLYALKYEWGRTNVGENTSRLVTALHKYDVLPKRSYPLQRLFDNEIPGQVEESEAWKHLPLKIKSYLKTFREGGLKRAIHNYAVNTLEDSSANLQDKVFFIMRQLTGWHTLTYVSRYKEYSNTSHLIAALAGCHILPRSYIPLHSHSQWQKCLPSQVYELAMKFLSAKELQACETTCSLWRNMTTPDIWKTKFHLCRNFVGKIEWRNNYNIDVQEPHIPVKARFLFKERRSYVILVPNSSPNALIAQAATVNAGQYVPEVDYDCEESRAHGDVPNERPYFIFLKNLVKLDGTKLQGIDKVPISQRFDLLDGYNFEYNYEYSDTRSSYRYSKILFRFPTFMEITCTSLFFHRSFCIISSKYMTQTHSNGKVAIVRARELNHGRLIINVSMQGDEGDPNNFDSSILFHSYETDCEKASKAIVKQLDKPLCSWIFS